MDSLEVFKKLRDVSADMVDALEKQDEKATESAMGRFMILMMQLDCLK